MIKTPLSTIIGGAFWTPESTILGGTSKTFDQLVKSLFVNGEQGFVYDPNDLTTMFQDSAGTVPVTGVGQPVGLMLDKSKGLVRGSNIAVNGTFETDTVWTKGAGWSISNGKAVRIAQALGSIISQPYNFVEGKFYEISVEYSNLTGTFYTALRGGVIAGNTVQVTGVNLSGSHKIIVQASSGSTSFDISMITSSGTGTFDNYSIREIAGSHSYQTTSSMRPRLVASPQRLDFDTADDNLITNFPAELTGCTVIRSVPNVGTKILTGQTISTPHNDNTDHCGLIVINRALTLAETSAITTEFNKRAGV